MFGYFGSYTDQLYFGMQILKSLAIFILAGLCEIGGGYLVWLWLKSGKPVWYGILGIFVLVLYAIVTTWQSAGFGRVYAFYGGIFIVLSLVWAWKVDNFKPDLYDVVGTAVASLGVWIIFYARR